MTNTNKIKKKDDSVVLTDVQKRHARAKHVEKIIRLAFDSLQSHLEYTYKHTSEGEKFHKDCVVEYLEIINNAVKLWE